MTGTALAIRDEQHYLATVHDVRALCERIDTVGDAKSLADKARTLQVWAERAKLGEEQVNLAGAARLWAERRAGELLRDAPKNRGAAGIGPIAVTDRDRNGEPPTLEEIGVTKQESSRWQGLAEIPEPDFQEAVEKATKNGKVTAAAVRRLAIPVSEELLAKQQRQTMVDGIDRALRSLEFSADHARAEVTRLLSDGDAGPLLPSRFDRVAEFTVAFASALRDGGIDG